MPAIVANLPVILAALREAAGPGVPIVGMNFYDPGLADVWFANPSALPGEIALIVGFNNVLEGIYAAAGDPVADVESAFSTTDTTLVNGVPLMRVDVGVRPCPRHPRERGRLRRDRAGVRGRTRAVSGTAAPALREPS